MEIGKLNGKSSPVWLRIYSHFLCRVLRKKSHERSSDMHVFLHFTLTFFTCDVLFLPDLFRHDCSTMCRNNFLHKLHMIPYIICLRICKRPTVWSYPKHTVCACSGRKPCCCSDKSCLVTECFLILQKCLLSLSTVHTGHVQG